MLSGDEKTGEKKMHWYVVNVHSGFEHKVVESVKNQVDRQQMSASIGKVMVPTETIKEVRRGKRVDSERKFFPGYILIEMTDNEEAFHLIRTLPRVSGFVGDRDRGRQRRDDKPRPISDIEAQRIDRQINSGVSSTERQVLFEIGDQVRVASGPFASFNGLVEEVDEGRGRVKVSVSIFGRATPVELEYTQIEKL